MRIIAGSARGTKIDAPEGLDTRPVTDKIRQSLFNIWQFEMKDTSFLDIFSGSGSMALEALSRGAKDVVMIEKAKPAADVIRRNLKTCHFENRSAELLQKDVFAALDQLKREGRTFDHIYADPPYTVDAIFHPVMEALSDGKLLPDDGVVCIRTKKEKKMKDEYGCLEKFREKTWGISTAHFYRKKESCASPETRASREA